MSYRYLVHGTEETEWRCEDQNYGSFEDTDDSEEYREWTTVDPWVWTTALNLTDE